MEALRIEIKDDGSAVVGHPGDPHPATWPSDAVKRAVDRALNYCTVGPKQGCECSSCQIARALSLFLYERYGVKLY